MLAEVETITWRSLLVPEITDLGRLPCRPPLDPYPDAQAALAGKPSSDVRSLDGTWSFHLAASPDEVPAGWADPDHDDDHGKDGWRPIEVPGVWTRQDTGDDPHYTNIVMPWDGEPPGFPDRNPTGLYRRRFDLPPGWGERRTVLQLGGHESVAFVWCNGNFVGMGKDSRLASEFDLTPQLVAGSNLLAVMVVRWSDSTWIEDQDHWFHAGLHRSVTLRSTGHRYLADVATLTDYDPATGTGTAEVTVEIGGGRGRPGAGVRLTLVDPNGARVARTEAAVESSQAAGEGSAMAAAQAYPGPRARATLTVRRARPWSAERPDRYRLLVELLAPESDLDGRSDRPVEEATALWVGFTRVEIARGNLLLNGEAIMIAGVNRHDHHPATGKVVTAEDIRADLVQMKRHNINAVRTAHYPNDPVLLDLCDELGLYVIDEANVESHARMRSLSDDQRWHRAIVDRVVRMVRRDRNHPCIIGWSLGNESGVGAGHSAAAAWVRHTDPSRIVHYEGLLGRRFRLEGTGPDDVTVEPDPIDRLVSDVVCPMYAPVDVIEAWARWADRTGGGPNGGEDRPLILCEYSHAMGNSNGSLDLYWEAFWTHRRLQGGFVWDWMDQGLDAVDGRGRPYWAYGGHFGDKPNDGNFCINGLVGPDRSPHPGLRELQWCARPVTVTLDDPSGRSLKVHNRRSFTTLDDLDLVWELLVDGEAVARGPVGVGRVEPGQTGVGRPAGLPRRVDGEASLVVESRLAHHAPWAPVGQPVAWDQLPVELPGPTVARPSAPRPTGSGPDPVRLEPVMSAGTGVVEEIRLGPSPVVVGDIGPNLWRAPIDNDGQTVQGAVGPGDPLGRWLDWGLDRLGWVVDEVDVVDDGGVDGRTTARRAGALVPQGGARGSRPGARAVVTVEAMVDGSVAVELEVDATGTGWDDLPRVGAVLAVAPTFDRLRWWGPGPDETYPDRRAGSVDRLWSSTVADQYHPYVRPQEHGTHVDARWFELTDRRGRGIRLEAHAGTRFLFSARFHDDPTLTEAQTVADLDPSETIQVTVDAAMRGVGTGACGPDVAHPFVVGPGPHRLRWSIHPVERS